jgi:hypothetical protein
MCNENRSQQTHTHTHTHTNTVVITLTHNKNLPSSRMSLLMKFNRIHGSTTHVIQKDVHLIEGMLRFDDALDLGQN